MKLTFRNDYGSTVWVAIMYYDPSGCSEGGTSTVNWDWATKGWWKIEPGQEAYVLNTNNQYACYYAEAADGGYWAGDYLARVFDTPFDYCNNLGVSGPPQWDVGMRLITVGPKALVRA